MYKNNKNNKNNNYNNYMFHDFNLYHDFDIYCPISKYISYNKYNYDKYDFDKYDFDKYINDKYDFQVNKKQTAEIAIQTDDFTLNDTFNQYDIDKYENKQNPFEYNYTETMVSEQKVEECKIIHNNMNNFNLSEINKRFYEIEIMYNQIIDNMDEIMDFTTVEEAKIKQEYFELKKIMSKLSKQKVEECEIIYNNENKLDENKQNLFEYNYTEIIVSEQKVEECETMNNDMNNDMNNRMNNFNLLEIKKRFYELEIMQNQIIDEMNKLKKIMSKL